MATFGICLVKDFYGRLDKVGYIPSTPEAARFFEETRGRYLKLGFKYVEFYDIHSKFDDFILSDLLSCNAIDLSAGDPERRAYV